MKNRDSLHFNWNKALSYNKPWNFVIGERESGKSVDSWLKIWGAHRYLNRPSIVLRRRIADITPAYIEDTQNVLNKFLETPIQLVYIKGDLKSGIVDVRIGEYGAEYSWQAVKKLPIFVRIIGLSNPLSRIKSLMLPDVRFIFFDEFICNLRMNEKYLGDEHFMIKEIYTTYNREASTPIRIIGAANPYSVYCPIFMGLGVDTSKLKPGAFVVGDDYVICCFQTPPELKEIILANNPMYQFDDAYKRYAFSGENVNDQNIKIHKQEPRHFKLKYVFRMGQDFISVHERKPGGGPYGQEERFWVCKHKSDWLSKISKRKGFLVFNFGDMCDGAFMLDYEWARRFQPLKEAMNKRNITFNCIDAQYMMEDIYNLI